MPKSLASTSNSRLGSILQARRAAVESASAVAPLAWRSWASSELSQVPKGDGPGLDGAYDDHRDADDRERLGQVFTPPPLARALARWMNCTEKGTLVDPAAGDGSLLQAVAQERLDGGMAPHVVLDSLTGWDLDPEALMLCRLGLVAWGLANCRGKAPGPLQLECRDALFGPAPDFDAVISNPPYLEAKRMGRAQPGLRERLRERFPALKGAFDLYLAFAYRSLELAPKVGLLVPNKITQGRYAAGFRSDILAQRQLAGLWDLSRMKPRPFPSAGVYPVLLHLEARASTRVGRAVRSEDLDHIPSDSVRPSVFAASGPETPWFVPFSETWPALEPLLAGRRLGEVAKVVTTCSFHKRGLREHYVTPTKPEAHAYPYLGGPSRSRKVELVPFAERWAGWWIRFDATELKKTHKNPLPPLSNFLRPKVIFNQHDRRMTAWADFDGRFVTKDVHPIAWPTDPAWSLEILAAVLNSTVFTALYNTLFQGIVVGGETYHYLPAFLKSVPVPEVQSIAGVDAAVRALQASPDPAAWDALDAQIAAAYGVDESSRQAMIATHLTRVGAPAPQR